MRVCAAFNSIHSLMMIAGGDSFQLCEADGASAADACRHRRCVSNCVDFVGFLSFFFLVFLQELQGIHHVDCGAALSCESVCAAQITFVIPEEAVIIKMIIKRD